MRIEVEEVERDRRFQVLAWAGGGGLFALALSPLFEWVSLGGGGIAGIQGDGVLVLVAGVVALAAFGVGCVTRRAFSVLVLAAQAWATVATLWMGTLIWKIGSAFDGSGVEDNPLAALFASQVSPGAGLYLGLIGGLAAAGALGFLVATHLHGRGRLRTYYIVQGSAVVAGALVAVLVGPGVGGEAQAEEGAAGGDGASARDFLDDTPAASAAGAKPSDEPERGVSGVVLEPELADKRFEEGRFQSFVSLDIDWHVAEAVKPVRAVKGRLLLQDLFDETKHAIGWTIHAPVREGERFTQKDTGFEYNQFMDAHQWARDTKPADMKLAFEPAAVVYQDGTAEGIDDDAFRSTLVEPELLDKGVKEERFETFVWMDVRWETGALPKPTRAIKGVLHLKDLFGEPRLSINTTLDEPLTPGEPHVEKGIGFELNEFKASDAWVANTRAENIRPVFEPTSVLYADGTRKDF
ncbi:MAG: hypothetical protein ACODAG_01075 [Myxococcota bacterium]